MKLENLNFGKPLSKDEQKQIKGGTPACQPGYIARCRCTDGTIMCVPASCTPTGYCESTGTLCAYPGLCQYHGGLAQPMDCSTNCPYDNQGA